MILTENQKEILDKAGRLKKANTGKKYTRLYFDFCKENHIPANSFRTLAYKTRDENVRYIHQVKPSMNIKDYLNICEKKILGKATANG